jgi:hypothetical protein
MSRAFAFLHYPNPDDLYPLIRANCGLHTLGRMNFEDRLGLHNVFNPEEDS